jgi:shikimate kinase
MGCGKSSVGRRLSGLTGHRFVDTDELVVQSEGRTIPEIFSHSGEDYFREVEQRSLEGLVGVCGIVLSTGGGLVLRPANRETLKKIGIVAWLDASPDVLFERATRSAKRPLLQTVDPRKTFDNLLSVRRELYNAAADFRIDSTRLSHDEAAQILLDEALRKHRRF